MNLFPHNAAFIDTKGSETGWELSTPVFSIEGLANCLNNYNGSTIESATQFGSFTYNSSTYGGSNAAIVQPYIRWLTAMGADDFGNGARWLPYWSMALFQAGSGTNGPSYDGKYACFNTSPLPRSYGKEGLVSMSFWYETLGDHSYIVGFSDADNRSVWINGARATNTNGENGTAYHRINPFKVTHVAFSSRSLTVLSQAICQILTAPSESIRISAPRVASGAFQLYPHKYPVKSYPRSDF